MKKEAKTTTTIQRFAETKRNPDTYFSKILEFSSFSFSSASCGKKTLVKNHISV